MADPTIAGRQPEILEVEPGTHYWCACGRSQNQPFCDGSHQGTEFSPVAFEVTEKKKVALCMCKHTGNPPYFDGTRTKL